MDNNLMDFDNFDPFAPSGNNLTEDHQKDFHTDPFSNDDWQTALQGLNQDNTNETKNTFVSTTTIKTSGDTNNDFFDQKFPSFGDNTSTKTTTISINSTANNKPNIINVSSTSNKTTSNSSRLFIGEGDDYNQSNNANNDINSNNNDDEEDFEEYDAVPYEASRKYTSNTNNNITTTNINNSKPTIGNSNPTINTTSITTTIINSDKLDDDDWMKDVEKIKLDNNNSVYNKPGQMALDNNPKREEEDDEDIEEYEWNEEDISGKSKFNGHSGRSDTQSKTNKVSYVSHDNYSRTNTTNIISNNERVNNNNPDHFEDMSFVDSRQSGKKGLSGLKEMEFNESYQASNHHSQQQHKDKTQADRAQSIIQHYGTASDNICQVCGKRAYEMEKITVDLIPYHKACFRCHCCHKLLSLGNYSVYEGHYYCRADFNKLFVLKGSHNFTPDVPATKHEVSKQDSYSSDNAVRSDDYVDGGLKQRQPDVVVSSNIYVLEDELPPPSLTRNLKAMFESSQPKQSQQRQQKTQQIQQKQVDLEYHQQLEYQQQRQLQQREPDYQQQRKPQQRESDYQQQRQPQQQKRAHNFKNNDDAAYYQDSKYISNQNQQNYGQNQQNYVQNQQNYHQTQHQHIHQEDIIECSDSQDENRFLEELPQSGLTKSLVAKWKGIEDVTTQRSRVRESERSPGLSRRSQSSSRLEVSNRMTTVDQRGDDWEDDEYKGRRYENKERSNRSKKNANGDSRMQGRSNDGWNDRYEDDRLDDRKDGGYRNEGRRDEGYRNERRRDEGYRNEGRRDEGYRNKGRRNEGYRNDGRKDDVYRNEGRRDEGYRNEGRRDEGYRNDGRRDKDYKNEGRRMERRTEEEDEHKKRNFKWQVKEATPLNRPCIVHGDTPRYQPVTGELINEKTSLSEVSREAEVRRMSAASDDSRKMRRNENDEYDRGSESNVIRGSYVTEILQEELPDSAAVKDAMQRFRSMEVSSRRMPLPTNQLSASQQHARYDPHLGPSQAFSSHSRRTTDEEARGYQD